MNPDFNGEVQEGVGLYQATVRNGERSSAARAYLYPILAQRQNLKVETQANATRILFQGRRAVGVEYRQGHELRKVHARREVIISCGVFQTPQLLMLSGIGRPDVLGELGIPVLHASPAVGQNLQDHPDFIFGYWAYVRGPDARPVEHMLMVHIDLSDVHFK